MAQDREREQNSTVINRRSPEATKQKMIDEIIENFDFAKCHIVMKLLNWEWAGRGVPTIEDLKISAVNRLESAIKGALDKKDILPLHSYYFSSTGGLKATAWRNRYGHLEAISLEFVLSEWDSDGD
jgi:hypothetical protein